MELTDLKEKLAALKSAVKESVASQAADRLARAKALAAQRQAKVEADREKRYLVDAGYTDEIGVAVAELEEMMGLQSEAERELISAKRAAAGDPDLIRTAEAVLAEITSAREALETNEDVRFFGWLKWLDKAAEEANPSRELALTEIEDALADNLLHEISGDQAQLTRDAQGEESDRETRQAPYFYIRTKPRGDIPEGQMEPINHFRYISGGVDFYVKTQEGARKRLTFFSIQSLWKAVTDAQKTRWETSQDIKTHSHLSLAQIAEGQTGQAWAEVTKDKPWEPKIWNEETQKLVPLTKDDKPVTNFGPIVVESPRPGILRILNVRSGMFHPLRLAGVWTEEQAEDGTKLVPVDFRFYTGNHPQTGQPNNFAGLKPVRDDVFLSQGQIGRLRAILCLAAGFSTAKTEETSADETATVTAASPSPPPAPNRRENGEKAAPPSRKKTDSRGSHKPPPKSRRRNPADDEE